jgi:dipeptidyl-peptidase III
MLNLNPSDSITPALNENFSFEFVVEQFADIRMLRYHVPDFEKLPLKEKILLYYLSEAALCGRDIIFDQNGKYNLSVRKILETILLSYSGDRTSKDFENFTIYTKRLWFANGIYHHYSSDKFKPGFSVDYFHELLDKSNLTLLPWKKKEELIKIFGEIIPLIFNSELLPCKTCKDSSKDLLLNSAVNFYENITEKEALEFYLSKRNDDSSERVSWGLNSRLSKENGKIKEQYYKVAGLYGEAIEKIVYWLYKAIEVAENDLQKQIIRTLIEFYKSGEEKKFDEYSILWVKDVDSKIDFVNGFIETYEDPLSIKATWESVVSFKEEAATHRTKIISDWAQWFEDHSPVDDRFKKKQVKGVSAKVITVVQLGGDCYPATPIGINLPNPDWIRQVYGSKSVSLDNISYAYDQASLNNGFLEEFCFSPLEVERSRKYGFIAGNLHTDLHECLGHGSGQLLPGISAEALKNYHATLEEARADLYALYYMMDPQILELKLLPSIEAAYTEYSSYILNGLLTQLTRVEPGKFIEEAHMRNRKMISEWCYEKGFKEKVIEKIINKGKTFIRINNFESLRKLFALLLAEVQRIKSEGDYEAGKALVESYGVKVDNKLHLEVLERYKKLDLAPFSGFINPVLKAIEKEGEITDIQISYNSNYTEQMLYYSEHYSFLANSFKSLAK